MPYSTLKEAVAATVELNPDPSIWTPSEPALYDDTSYILLWCLHDRGFDWRLQLDIRWRLFEANDGGIFFADSYAELVRGAATFFSTANAFTQDLASRSPYERRPTPLWAHLRSGG